MLSVIVPIYNAAAYLEEAIKSIVNQEFSDMEIILVNDGSIDESGEIIDKWKAKDDRIKILHKKNEGVSAARNDGLSIATGEFVTFVDADDLLSPDTYQRNMRYLNEDDQLEMVIFPVMEKWGSMEEYKKRYRPLLFSDNEQIFSHWYLSEEYLRAYSCNKVIRSSFWGDARFPINIGMCEDLYLFTSLFSKAKRIRYTDEGLYYYRKLPDSVSQIRHSYKKKEGMFLAYKKVFDEMVNRPALMSEVPRYYVRLIDYLIGLINIKEGDHSRDVLYIDSMKSYSIPLYQLVKLNIPFFQKFRIVVYKSFGARLYCNFQNTYMRIAILKSKLFHHG